MVEQISLVTGVCVFVHTYLLRTVVQYLIFHVCVATVVVVVIVPAPSNNSLLVRSASQLPPLLQTGPDQISVVSAAVAAIVIMQ